MNNNRLIIIPILIFLTLGVLRVKNWQILHDEGVTFDQAIGAVDINVVTGNPISWNEIASTLNNSSNHGIADVTFALRYRGMHPPAYYYLINAWTKCFGTYPLALRIPGITLGVISLIGIWFLAKRITNRKWAGFLTAVLLSVSIVFIDYNIYLRPYGLELAITIWATLAMLNLSALRNRKTETINWLIFLSFSILGIYTIYHYAFTLVWHFCYIYLFFLITGKLNKTELTKLIAAGLLIILAYIPWINILRHHIGITASNFYFNSLIPLENWPNSLKALFAFFIFGYHTKPGEAVSLGLKIITVITTFFFFKVVISHFKKNYTESVFWFSTIFLPLAIIAADIWHDTHTFFILRTSIALLPLIILAVVTGIIGVNNVFFKGLLLACWISILLFTSLSNIGSVREDVLGRKVLANYILKHDRPAHVVVFNNRERGYLVPVLVAFRDRGVKQIRVSIVGKKNFIDIISKLSRVTTVKHISLVNLDIKYDRDVVWTNAEIEKAVEIIKRAGKTSKIFKLSGRYI